VLAASVFNIPCVAVASNPYYESKMQPVATGATTALLRLDPDDPGAASVSEHLQRLLAAER